MDISVVLEKLDGLLAEQKREEAESYMLAQTQLALQEGDLSTVLTLLNELVGFYRSVGKHEQALGMAAQAVKLLEQIGMKGTVPYATTLLNMATAFRAAGKPNEALILYEQTKEIYEEQLDENDYRVAGLYNNWSGALEQSERYEDALACLNKAKAIIETFSDKQIDLATTLTNMAGVQAKMGNWKQAKISCRNALDLFEAQGDSYHSSGARQLWEQLNEVSE